MVLPYSTYDRLSETDLGAITDNKRLGRTLEFIKLVQDKRNNNRSLALPAGDGPLLRRRKPIKKKSQRSINSDDMLDALHYNPVIQGQKPLYYYLRLIANLAANTRNKPPVVRSIHFTTTGFFNTPDA